MLYELIVFLPLAGALIAGLFGRALGEHGAEITATLLLCIAAVLSAFAFYDVAILGNAKTVVIANFITSGDMVVDWSLRIDTLTAVMLVVVNGVSSLVHIYSIGYMHEDEARPRFFAYLSLFTFAMLMLVTADNLVQMFFGWEGVGLASYLLIGFWFRKPSANAAAIKAFVVNRVGDLGFMLGIFGTYLVFDTTSIPEILAAAPGMSGATITFLGERFQTMDILCILLFIGAMGKSAQLGLHTWLPDAMEGPTPVSALIHAATMVTAGIFMVARMSPLFELSDTALNFVLVIGAITALFMGFLGIVQNDIKRVVAYSTLSQLGYMTMALGAGAYGAGIFHLMTHAFFKALLFLGSGSVIHALSGEQDMRKMGALWNKIPITAKTFAIGTIAIAGLPPLAGFFSKDEILWKAWSSELGRDMTGLLWFVGAAAAAMTAFYMARLCCMTFFGKSRVPQDVEHHIHESPKSMTIPLMALASSASSPFSQRGSHTVRSPESGACASATVWQALQDPS